MENSFTKIFNPQSIAIIGASEISGKMGERRTKSLIKGGYSGKIFLINPKRKLIFDQQVYPSITDINDQVDLVFIIIQSKFIFQAVIDSISMGAKGIIIITASIGETGQQGKIIEQKILDVCDKAGAKIIGPNCSGIFSASASLNFLGVPPIKKGPFSIIAQSGNIIDSITHYAQLNGVGFSKIISAGNAIGFNFHEYLSYLGQDDDTKVILIYLEGIKNGSQLIKTARKVSRIKPIIVLKVGKSNAGKRAAASHTGSLASNDDIVEAAFKQAGIIRVSNVDEMFDIARVLAYSPLPKGKRIAIISEGGGDNSVAADNAERYSLEVPLISENIQEKIRPFLLKGMPAHNPIDYGGIAEEKPEIINKIAAILMEDSLIDSLYITGFFGGFKEIIAEQIGLLEEQTAKELVKLVKMHQKPIILTTSFANENIPSLTILKENGIFVTPSSERAAQCLSYLSKFAQRQTELRLSTFLLFKDINLDPVKDILKSAQQDHRTSLLETEANKLLKLYDISPINSYLATNEEEALRYARQIGKAVAMKIVSPEILHKSDSGGVKLNLKTEDDIKKGYRDILQNIHQKIPSSKIVGVLVSPMASKGQECIIGMIRDFQFGPVVMFGLGGIFVEILKDVSFRVTPLTELDLEEMITELKGYPLLAGFRGQRPKDIQTIKDIILKISKIAIDNPEIKEIDLNPVIVHEKGASIVDARIIIE